MVRNLIKQLNKIKAQGLDELEKIKSLEDLDKFKTKYFGRKGLLKQVFQDIGKLDLELKKQVGKMANDVKSELEKRYQDLQFKVKDERDWLNFDETIPGVSPNYGTIHPITQFIYKIVDVFISMGFEVVEDREVETVEYNFDKLNIPKDHPARDMWDTFYVKTKGSDRKFSSVVLRTHTSPVQIRAMEKRKPPVRIVVPGRVYRHEATDASHETCFYQLEGLVIDKDVSVSNMIYVLDVVLKRVFGNSVKIRVRPSFFPFVEPGHEIDMSCILCDQRGRVEKKNRRCSVCGGTGWLEMLGAGMVHPNVLKNMGVDHKKYSGFAFGMGIDRLMMLYHGVDDIRLSYSGDLRFLRQF